MVFLEDGEYIIDYNLENNLINIYFLKLSSLLYFTQI